MQEYKFEYTLMGRLILISIGSLISAILIADILPKFGLVFGFNLNVLVGLAVGILAIYMARSIYKKEGEAILGIDIINLKIDGNDIEIQFKNIKSYKIEYGNGVSLNLKLQSGPPINIIANNNFCNAQLLDSFCASLEDKLIAYKVSTNYGLERKPSIFEYKWMLYFLILATSIIVIMTFQSLSKTGNIQPSIISAIYIFSVLWSAWLIARIRKK